MANQKRTEIRIETHEITIIRFGKFGRTAGHDRDWSGADVISYDHAGSGTELSQAENESEINPGGEDEPKR